jgi:hypothetical protein
MASAIGCLPPEFDSVPVTIEFQRVPETKLPGLQAAIYIGCDALLKRPTQVPTHECTFGT